jgi:hypothetical protein
MRHLLAEDEARDKLNGQACQNKLQQQAERSLELLTIDEVKFADEMVVQAQGFASRLHSLTSVRAVGVQHWL